jgi:hypothetical protein
MKLILLLNITLACSAETVVFHDGRTVAGKLLGMDSHEVKLERCGGVEKYAREDVKSIGMEKNPSVEPCAAPSSPHVVDLPSDTRILLHLLDFIDSTTVPPGQVFRGDVEEPIKLSGRVVISAHSRVILKLVDAGGSTERPNLAIDLIGIQLGTDWAALEPASGKDSVLSLKSTTNGDLGLKDITPADFVSKRVLLRGDRVLIPSGTHITFTLNRAIRLITETK